MTKFVVMEEEKLKLNALILQEFDIIDPISILFAGYFDHWSKGFNLKTISY